MSGDFFSGQLLHINDVIEEIEKQIGNGVIGESMEDQPLRRQSAVLREFENGLMALKRAAIYVRRIDYFLSADDGAEEFLAGLKKDLEELGK